MNLENKTLLITGANGGLGQALVRYAINHNAAKIYCCARDVAKLEPLKTLGENVELCPLDITDKSQIAAFAQTIGSIDILINNAGVNSGKRVFDESTDDFEVNVQGTLNVCRGLRTKISKGGAIVNISSIPSNNASAISSGEVFSIGWSLLISVSIGPGNTSYTSI